MGNPGMAIFVLFFGISLIEAFRAGRWGVAALWLAAGALFWMMDRMRRVRGKATPHDP